jgi:hypothetical protein
MPNDVFQRNVSNIAGTFTADGAKATFGTLGTNLLIQQLQFQYAQTVTRLYGVGETDQYYVGGRTNGQMNANRVIGPSASSSAIYTGFGDVCSPKNISLQFGVSCQQGTAPAATAGGGTNNYTLDNAVLTQVGLSVASQDMIINEAMTFMFASLENK